MAPRGLSDVDVEQLTSWPGEVTHSELLAFIELTVADVRWIRSHRIAVNQVGLAMQLCALRRFGFVPDDLTAAPSELVSAVTDRLDLTPGEYSAYAGSTVGRSRREHIGWVIAYAGWTTCRRGEWKRLDDWLVDRALEHDTVSVLFRDALKFLRAEQIVRPGLDRLMRAIGSARVAADAVIFERLLPLLDSEFRMRLDSLIDTDPDLGMAPLVWLATPATSASAAAINDEIAKLEVLRELHGERLDAVVLAAERRRQLAGTGRRTPPKDLRQMSPERRYPVLVASVIEHHGAVIDEIAQLFSQGLSTVENTARRQVGDRLLDAAQADAARLDLLDEMIDVIRDDDLDDADVGRLLRQYGPQRLAAAKRAPDEKRPRDGGHMQLMDTRYSHLRKFTRNVLAVLEFSASVSPSPLLEAVELLQHVNQTRGATVPFDAPSGFVPTRWQPYLAAARADRDRVRFRHYWEIATLLGLRDGLRSGEIWIRGSRRYANPASYLIPPEDWSQQRTDVLERINKPVTWDERRHQIDTDIENLLDDLEPILAAGDGPIRIDTNGKLTLTPLAAEVVAAHVEPERNQLHGRLPQLHLIEILVQTDIATGFTGEFTHPSGATPRFGPVEHRRNLFAALMAQACNFGTTRMSQLTGISVNTLDHYTRNYLREETLKEAINTIINAHHRLPLAHQWGGGTLSSSDGLRMPMEGKSTSARRLKKYFADEGLTTYAHVSDQHTTFGTQIIVSTERDAAFTLDEILGNTSDLAPVEHTVDTHGQTYATFALFDLCGYRLSPRIAKITARQLWRPHPASNYTRWPTAGPLLSQPVQTDIIERHWDDLLRVAGSLKKGTVSAALLLTRLHASSRQHPLAKAILEYGKLIFTIHTLRWYSNETFRRRIGRQLNRGEALHDLRREIGFANEGKMRHRQLDDQTMQVHCITLVTNACVYSTTTYLQDAIDAERTAGNPIHDDTIARTSPAHFAHLNVHGTYDLNIEDVPAHHDLNNP